MSDGSWFIRGITLIFIAVLGVGFYTMWISPHHPPRWCPRCKQEPIPWSATRCSKCFADFPAEIPPWDRGPAEALK